MKTRKNSTCLIFAMTLVAAIAAFGVSSCDWIDLDDTNETRYTRSSYGEAWRACWDDRYAEGGSYDTMWIFCGDAARMDQRGIDVSPNTAAFRECSADYRERWNASKWEIISLWCDEHIG